MNTTLPPNVTAANTNATGPCAGNGKERSDWAKALGFILAVISCFLSTVGLMVMKWSADVEAGRPLCRRPKWWAGFILNTASEVGLSTFALWLAPLALISPVGALAIVFSALMARFWNEKPFRCCGRRLTWPGEREDISPSEGIALVVTLAGAVMVPAFGPSSEHEADLFDSQSNLANVTKRAPYIGYAFAQMFFVLVWFGVLLAPCLRPIRPGPKHMLTSVFSSLGSGMAGSFSMLSSKLTMKAVTLAIGEGRGDVFGLWLTWLAIFMLIACAPVQLWFLNVALASGKAVFIVPLYSVCIMLLAMVQGGLFFDEFNCLSPVFLAMFFVSIAVIVVGIVILAISQDKRLARKMSTAAARTPSGIAELPPPEDIVDDKDRGGGGPKQALARDKSGVARAGFPGTIEMNSGGLARGGGEPPSPLPPHFIGGSGGGSGFQPAGEDDTRRRSSAGGGGGARVGVNTGVQVALAGKE